MDRQIGPNFKIEMQGFMDRQISPYFKIDMQGSVDRQISPYFKIDMQGPIQEPNPGSGASNVFRIRFQKRI